MSVTIHNDMLEAAQLYEDGAGLIYALICWAELGVEPDRSASWYPTFIALKERARLSKEAHVNGRKGGRPRAENQGFETRGLEPTAKTPSNETTESGGSPLSKEEKSKEEKSKEEKSKGRFNPPSVQEVQAYISEKEYSVDPEAFVDFYASKGWKVGNSPMKDWRACVRTWQKREVPKPRVAHTLYDRGVVSR